MPYHLTNSVQTWYEVSGSGQAVVLIHGHSADLRMWDYQATALLAAGFRVIRYDVRGHGRSGAPPTGYTWEEYAADLRALLDVLAPDEGMHLAGLSMGGGIAIQFALDSPAQVRSLTLVDSALPGFAYSDEFSRGVEELLAAVRSEGPRSAFERLWLPHPFFDGIRRFPERFSFLREMVLAYRAPDYAEGAIPAGYEPAVAARLQEVAAPALVVAGEHDVPDFLLIARLLAENLPDARLTIMDGCWHLPPLEAPDAFNALLVDFLRSAP